MPNTIYDFKRYLENLTPEEQLREINRLIEKFNKSYLPCPNINKKFNMLTQQKIFKKEALINYKSHKHYENNCIKNKMK